MFSSFPSIEQFRNVIKKVQMNWNLTVDSNSGEKHFLHGKLPIVKYLGTVKMHGTNAGIVIKNNELFLQSREQSVDLEKPTNHYGFSGYAKNLFDSKEFKEKIEKLKKELNITDSSSIAIYGEWIGKGVQKGVAVSTLEKTFVIFKLKVIEPNKSKWVPLESLKTNLSIKNLNLYTTQDFPVFEVSIDFERPEYAQNQFVKLTQDVENECPVGKEFGSLGVGEGIVWSPASSEEKFIEKIGYLDATFKTKGDKHSVTKVKVIAAIDIEKVENLNQFVENTCTEQRLNQGLDFLREHKKEIDLTSISDFLRWVYNDVVKEEKDTMIANNIDGKELGKALSKKARQWYFEQVNNADPK